MVGENKFGRIKLVAFDFDGVFTDNRVYVDQEGREMVCCWRSDGIGLKMLKNIGVKTVVISMESNPVVKKRCEKLGIECVTEQKDKLSAFKSIIEREGIAPEQTCFVGNDLPDLGCMKLAGCSVAVRGSAKEVLGKADYITKAPGGRGAVREVCELIYRAHRRATN